MTKTQLFFYDTTLRDGGQSADVNFTTAHKRQIAAMLGKAGIQYIEGGFPGASDVDTNFFKSFRDLDLGKSRLIAFGMTLRRGMKTTGDDSGLRQVLQASGHGACLVAKAWDWHVTDSLGMGLDEYLGNVKRTLTACEWQKGAEKLIDLEHFFDGYRANPAYTRALVQTCLENGARFVTLCDTNGGTFPDDIEECIEDLLTHLPQARGKLGIHCHNDMGLATANTLAAIKAGCTLVQGTINGLGERTGNANLLEIIPSLMLKDRYKDKYECGLPEGVLSGVFPELRRLVYRLSGRKPNPNDPYYGENAFSTKAGIHASALLKNSGMYEHLNPALVGNQRRILFSREAGISGLCACLDRFGLREYVSDIQLKSLFSDLVQQEEENGLCFALAENTLELILRQHLLQEQPILRVMESNTLSYSNGTNSLSSCSISFTFNNTARKAAGTSEHGPLDAVNHALQSVLDSDGYAGAREITLCDYDVHNLGEGTDTRVRVVIEFEGVVDGQRRRWKTSAVSENNQDAAVSALVQGYDWFLRINQTQTKPELAVA